MPFRALFKSLFLACLDRTCISSYTFSEILKFEAFKTKKTALKNVNEEKYRQSENKELEAFKRFIIF